ncbi:MAG: 1-(5-phosphoribosyl)-5-[(5-phosphoribosylamino)methylideneamino]imidazole-4-carboxamide isomerase [Flavobacteriaceae bacterium]|nr:1-(5-phosphoribosyl)-5-[(5-phosphoribosylamino)methylideneamino]imidazole-4-carboxamide isomerase [Lactococcus lactis]
MRLIPAIDIIEGKCVRLTRGDYTTKKIYSEDPLETAMAFEDHGIENLHLVDLDGAKAERIVNYKTLEKIASKTQLHIDYGGGLKTNEDLKITFESGAHQITGGSIAVNNRSLFLAWLNKYGSERIILGADVNNNKIATSAWEKTSDIDVLDFINSYQKKGIKNVISTDISKDGMLKGPSIDLYKNILKTNPNLRLIASGGVSQLSDLDALRDLGCEAVIIGKAMYEDKISLKDLEKYVLKN